jgi:rSAM/selenodomain-associated transferase 2
MESAAREAPGRARLSIVVPVLNEAGLIAAALQRLTLLRGRGAEVIVADGGSGDGSAALALPHADRVIAAPRGRAAQMNAGAALASGDILLFLHVDSRLPEEADRLIREGLARSGRNWGRFDIAIEGRHPLLPVIAWFMNRRSRLTGICTGDQGIFVRRSLFEECGGFPPIALMEDIALSRELRRHGPPLCIPRRVLTSGRRWERGGTLRTVLLMWGLRLAYFLGVDPRKLAGLYDAR